MKPCIAAVVFVACVEIAVCASATTVVVYRTTTEVTVGADSLVVGSDHCPVAMACKVRPCGDVFAAWSGTYTAYGFDYESVSQFVCRPGVDLFRIGDDFRRLMDANMGFVIGRALPWSPAMQRRISKGEPIIEVVFFGVDGPEAATFIFQRVFGIEQDGEWTAVTETYPCFRCNDARPTAFAFGVVKAIGDFGINPLQQGGNAVSLINRWIGAEIERSPSEVGGPVDIVSVRATGAHWDQRKAECRDDGRASQSSP